jgi:parallel beta helix pectate lyase-like protein
MMKLRNVCLFVCVLTGLLLGILKNCDAVESKKIILTDTTWKKAESPYVLKDGILVYSGATLTIEPGVVVKFDKDRALEVQGTIIARGTPDEKITFTRNTFDNWGYIYFSDSSTDAVYDTYGDYAGGSILEHCIIEYGGGSNVNPNGAVRLENAHPLINYCTIQNNSASGIVGWGLSGTLIIANTNITNNTITNANGGGINISSGGTTSILNCAISKNTCSIINGYSGGGIYISSSGTTTILNNTIDSNIGGGIYISQNNYNNPANISNNIISNNTSSAGGGIYCYTTGGNSTTNFSGNIVYNNTASNNGGGIGTNYTSGTINIVNNIIGNNTSGNGGGISVGPYCYYACYSVDINISNNSLIGNSAKNSASVSLSTKKDFKYNTITNNKATDENSYAVWIGYAPPVFNYNNIFGNNTTYEL